MKPETIEEKREYNRTYSGGSFTDLYGAYCLFCGKYDDYGLSCDDNGEEICITCEIEGRGLLETP